MCACARVRVVRVVVACMHSIPGTALHDGIRWNWETFPEFLDDLEKSSAVMDFAPQIGHAAVRSFVLGERCVDPAFSPNEEEVQAMADVVQEAVEAGAAGWSSTFAEIHMDGKRERAPRSCCVFLTTGASSCCLCCVFSICFVTHGVNCVNLERCSAWEQRAGLLR
eukprot:COSAG06_NODE_2344_length_7035_cov_13.462659_5_plen_166_part_00